MAKRRRSAEKEAFWRLALEEQQRSGLSVRAFCEREGLSAASLYAWRRQLRERDQEHSVASAESADLIPVEVVASVDASPSSEVDSSSLELVTPGGFTLRFPATIESHRLSAVLTAVAQVQGATPC